MDTPKGQNGQLYLACLYPEKVKMTYQPLKEKVAGAVGHVLGIDAEGDDTFTYWFGSGWSGYDVPNMAVWQTLLESKARALKTPLKVSVE